MAAPAAPEVADSTLLVGVDPAATLGDRMAVVRRAEEGAAAAGPVRAVGRDILAVPTTPGETAAKATELRAQPHVRYVEPNYAIHADVIPNDPSYGSLYGLQAAHGIAAPAAWDTTTGSSSVVVGVLDTGIDYTHPDLAANVWTNTTGAGGCPIGTHGYNAQTGSCLPLDDNNHGTHVSGTIGAVGNNGVGVVGVNWTTSLMGLKMLDASGSGTTADAVNAINFAINAKAVSGVNVRVLSASWTGPDYSVSLRDEIALAGSNDILFVTAAGNNIPNGPNVDSAPEYPCAYALSTEICVAATDSVDQLASFSNFGVNTVDLAAPGVSILSTVPAGYLSFSGTSMATPHVSGAAALLLAATNLTTAQLKTRLLGAVDPLASLSGKVRTGGRLNVCKAMPGCGVYPAVPPTAPIGFSAVQSQGNATLSWLPPASNGGSPITRYDLTNDRGLLDPTPGLSKTATYPALPSGTTHFFVTATTAAGTSSTASVGALPLGGGFEVDGWGGLHPFGIGGNPAPGPATGGAYWNGWDIARGVTLLADGTGGFVVDGYGPAHPFGVNGHAPPPVPSSGPSWPFVIARGITLLRSGGSGGYIGDGWGAPHPFDGAPAIDPGTWNGPYWNGWNIARGVTVTTSGTSGYVLDGWGAPHPFNSAPPIAATWGGPYWPGWDIARGIAL